MADNAHILALLTRPQPDAESTAAKLSRLGIDSFIEPLLEISFNHISHLPNNITAIIVTSGNALAALDKNNLVPKDFPIITVGINSAEKALSYGFSNIKHASGDAVSLCAFIKEQYQPEENNFLYLHGDIITADISAILQSSGFKCSSLEIYKANAKNNLSEKCLKLFEAGEFSLIPIYSQRTGQILAALLQKYGFTDKMTKTLLFCISEKVAKPLENIKFAEIIIAKKPDGDSLIEAIKDYGF